MHGRVENYAQLSDPSFTATKQSAGTGLVVSTSCGLVGNMLSLTWDKGGWALSLQHVMCLHSTYAWYWMRSVMALGVDDQMQCAVSASLECP